MVGKTHPLGSIPASLWDEHSGKLKLPEAVAAAYLNALSVHELIAEASGPRPDPPPVGGYSQEHTDQHFAHAFDGSVARTQLAVLDPHQTVPIASATLSKFLTGGSLCLVDVPCGAGAASIALIGTIAQLRAEGAIPRLPMSVHIIGGEISNPARAYAAELFDQLKLSWSSQGIFLTHDLMYWDVLSTVSNGELVERLVVRKSVSPQALVIVSNFNGFLIKANKKDKAMPQLAELFKFASGQMNAAVWIEPNMNAATGGLFPWLKKNLLQLHMFTKLLGPPDVDETAEAYFEIPIKAPECAKVRLCILPIELVKSHDT